MDLAPAARDEVFDVFKAEIDFSFTMPSMEIYDSLGYAENGMMPNDSTYIDMNFGRDLIPPLPLRQTSQRRKHLQ